MADWGEVIGARIRMAKMNPPNAQLLLPELNEAAKRGTRAAALAGKSVRTSVKADGSHAELLFTGPGQQLAKKVARRRLDAQAPEMASQLRKAAVAKIKGTP